MKIKKYNSFLESDMWQDRTDTEFGSIYEWFNTLKKYMLNSTINESDLKNQVNHFLGEGEWSKIDSHFTKLVQSLGNVDLDFIKDKLLDIFDEYLFVESKFVTLCTLYADVDIHVSNILRRYNGLITCKNIDNSEKLSLISHFLVGLLSSTLFIAQGPSAGARSGTFLSRTTYDEVYVTSPKWSMKNISKIKFKIEEIDKISQSALSKFLDDKQKYNLENSLELYRPGIYIGISAYYDNQIDGKELTTRFEEVMPSLLSELDYEDVIWPWKADLPNINDYDLKILLKM